MVTLNTILYEGNFRQFLTEDCWFFTFKSKYITKKQLTINNLSSIDEFNKLVNSLKINYDFDVIFVNDYEQDTLTYFSLDMNKESKGYYYSIPYFVSFLTIKTPYIFNVLSDCCLIINVKDNYIEKSIKILSIENNYSVTCLPWSKHWGNNGTTPLGIPITVTCVGEWEQMHCDGYNNKKAVTDFWCSDAFSDQVFIGNIEKLKKINYNLKGYTKQVGPDYGGPNIFENRMAEHLASVGSHRLIFKSEDQYYNHI